MNETGARECKRTKSWYESMLDVDAARVSAGQISDRLLEGQRALPWILPEQLFKPCKTDPPPSPVGMIHDLPLLPAPPLAVSSRWNGGQS